MKSITSYTKEEISVMNQKWKELHDKIKGVRVTEIFKDYKKSVGYAHYEFSGEITDRLIQLLGHEPTSDEIIMIVDNGFSHFGATCTIIGRRFGGRVNTD